MSATAAAAHARPAADARTVRALAAVRVVFGLAWVIDATLKWSPSFTDGFVSYISGQRAGQPAVVKSWLGWWVSMVHGSPTGWAYLVAAVETLIAIGLVFGALSRLVCVGGAVFSLLVWATAEGFGGPYNAGSTDIGTSIIYAILFVTLLVTGAGGWASLDRRLSGTRLGVLCARPRSDLPAPSRVALALASAGVAAALAVGLIVAFVDSPAPAGSMAMSAPAVAALPLAR